MTLNSRTREGKYSKPRSTTQDDEGKNSANSFKLESKGNPHRLKASYKLELKEKQLKFSSLY